MSAVVAALVQADLLILLSDIDGLFTDDPNINPDARFIDLVENLDEEFLEMGNPHPRALWEPEEWLPSLRLPGLPLLQE